MRNRLHKVATALLALAGMSLPLAAQSYKVANLVSDGSVTAAVTDPNFINPWAISTSPTWWISTANTGFNYVVSATPTIAFKVVVPSASGVATATGLPAGSVTTAGASGMLLSNGTKASFLFSTLDGTISGWNSKLGTNGAISTVMVNNSSFGASYPGLTIVNVNATTSYILAPNFGTGNAVEVYDSTFQKTKLAGSFTDPNLPTGYSPWAVHVLGNTIYVSYALRTASAPYLSVNGAGNGVVDAFDFNGNFVARIAAGGNLNSPWGIAIAPANFGVFSNDILIGNFGDGKINVFDPKTFAYLGQMMDSTGKALSYGSLWELLPGGTAVGNTTSVSAGDTSTVYFTAGLTNEAHGLLAGISNGTTAGATPTYGFSMSSSAATVKAGASTQVTYSLASTNGFSGTVALACSGLPAGATCTFSQSQPSVSVSTPTTGTLTIQTTAASALAQPLPMRGNAAKGITLAILLPGALLLFRRRRAADLLSAFVLGLLLLGSAALIGCGNGTTTPITVTPPVTPAGQSTVTVTATSGSVAQQSTIALTVQ